MSSNLSEGTKCWFRIVVLRRLCNPLTFVQFKQPAPTIVINMKYVICFPIKTLKYKNIISFIDTSVMGEYVVCYDTNVDKSSILSIYNVIEHLMDR